MGARQTRSTASAPFSCWPSDSKDSKDQASTKTAKTTLVPQRRRSRTPPNTRLNRKESTPVTKGIGKGNTLPFPWEEHWSDEYNLCYFWNSKTGESAWERPKPSGGKR